MKEIIGACAACGDNMVSCRCRTEEKMEEFKKLMDDKRGRGRPSKGYEEWHLQTPPETREKVQQLSQILGISQGEVVAAAVRVYLEQMRKA